MKICTNIIPNNSGVVLLHGINGKEYTFAQDAELNALVCDIDDESVCDHVLSLGDSFFPADELGVTPVGTSAKSSDEEVSLGGDGKLIEDGVFSKPAATAAKAAKPK
jgi:hypothetical protein